MNPVAPRVLRSERERDSPHLRTWASLLVSPLLTTPHSKTYNLSFWQCQFFGRVAVVELACKCYQLEVSLAKLFAENEGLL